MPKREKSRATRTRSVPDRARELPRRAWPACAPCPSDSRPARHWPAARGGTESATPPDSRPRRAPTARQADGLPIVARQLRDSSPSRGPPPRASPARPATGNCCRAPRASAARSRPGATCQMVAATSGGGTIVLAPVRLAPRGRNASQPPNSPSASANARNAMPRSVSGYAGGPERRRRRAEAHGHAAPARLELARRHGLERR